MIRKLQELYRASADERGKRILRHILMGAGLKVVNSIVSILIIPLYLSLLTEVSFGIWLTVTAVINWFNIFDLGLGNGLRNRFAEARAQGNEALAASYVSTSYFCLAGVSLFLLLLFLLADAFANWGSLFAAPEHLHTQVNAMTRILMLLFLPQFVFQLVKVVLTADQRPAWGNAINSLINVLQMAMVWLLITVEADSLPVLAIAIGGVNLLVLLLSNLYFFLGKYRRYRPSYSRFALQHIRPLMELGIVFFVLQAAAVVVFMTDNLIISRVLGPEEVPAYNVAYRYFNFAAVFFGLVTTPFWSAFTDAFAKREMEWIASMVRRLLRLWVLLALLCILMLVFSNVVYRLWLGDALEIPFLLSAIMAAWVTMSMLLGIYGTVLSGMGVLRLSLYHAVLVMLINIPLSVWLAGMPALGSAGVILATLIGLMLRAFFQPLQCYKILNGSARGIWSR